MRIFIAGATGTLGRPVVRQLLARGGHDVIGLTRSPERAQALTTIGVHGVVGNVLDARSINAVVAAARPDHVVHLLTALPPGGPLRKRDLAQTNELRIEGTANLIQASVETGVHRLVAESFVGIYGAPAFVHRASEDEPLPIVGPGVAAEAIAALRSLEAQLQEERASGRLTTVALRIGFLYGPDVPGTRGLVRQARAGRLFLPRDFGGVAAFVHVDDAARAIVAAVEHSHPSAVYNVVDDEPMALTTFAAKLVAAIGAPPIRHLPRWMLKLAAPVLAGYEGVTLRLSNEKIKRELEWSPRHPTVDSGLAELSRLAKDGA